MLTDHLSQDTEAASRRFFHHKPLLTTVRVGVLRYPKITTSIVRCAFISLLQASVSVSSCGMVFRQSTTVLSSQDTRPPQDVLSQQDGLALLTLFIRREELRLIPYFLTFHLSISVSNSLGWALVWFIAVLVQA
jgi:hypothetical protein